MTGAYTFYEFFAGGGMARAGLGADWQCLFANDFDPKKVEAYRANWGAGEMQHGDIYALDADDLPGYADLAWGSFPCQDLSLAGNGAGLAGQRSEAFWGYHRIIDALRLGRRAPKLLVLENVVGALTSNGGRDFEEIIKALDALGYQYGALTLDARYFVPQSRPRLFLVAVRKDIALAPELTGRTPQEVWASKALQRAHERLPAVLRRNWLWWRLPEPGQANMGFSDVIEENPASVNWHSPAETKRFLDLMSAHNRRKVESARRSGKKTVGAIYRRTRLDEAGRKVQRAEIRFDLAGCLRTPSGGSSRQFIMVIDGEAIGTRLLSSREAARLMGLPDEYTLPANYNEAYHLMGDGLAVPVVRFLAEHLLEPMLAGNCFAVAAE